MAALVLNRWHEQNTNAMVEELWDALGATAVPAQLAARATKLRAQHQKTWRTVPVSCQRSLAQNLRSAEVSGSPGQVLRLVRSAATKEMYEIAIAIRGLAILGELMVTGELPGPSPGAPPSSSPDALPGEKLVYDDIFDHAWYENASRELGYD